MEEMSRETWTRLEPLLDEALDLEPARRADWLRELRVREPAAADAVARLLDAGQVSEPILDVLHPADLPARGLTGHLVRGVGRLVQAGRAAEPEVGVDQVADPVGGLEGTPRLAVETVRARLPASAAAFVDGQHDLMVDFEGEGGQRVVEMILDPR